MEETPDPSTAAFLQWSATLINDGKPIDPAVAFTAGWRWAVDRYAAPVSDDPNSD